MATLPNITLKTVDFKPTVFTPIEYKMELADANIPQRSMQLQTVNAEKAEQAGAKYTAEANTIYEALNPTEREWFAQKQKEIEDQFNYEASIGNTGTALRIAVAGGRNLAQSKELQNKVLANKMYQTKMDSIDKDNSLDFETKRYYKAHNTYYDDGTGEWKEQVPVIADVDTTKALQLVSHLTSEYFKSNSNTNNTTTPETVAFNGQVIQEGDNITKPVRVNKITQNDTSHSRTERSKTSKRLNETFNKILKDSGLGLAFQQKYTVHKWALEDYERRMNDASLTENERNDAAVKHAALERTMLNKDGMPYASYKEWVDATVRPVFDSMAYEHISTSDASTNGVTYTQAGLDANQRQAELDAALQEEQLQLQSTQVRFRNVGIDVYHKTTTPQASDFTEALKQP